MNKSAKDDFFISGLMKDAEMKYGIQAKKRFQIKYSRFVVPHMSSLAMFIRMATKDSVSSDRVVSVNFISLII
jgi:hypothetical protein